MKPDDLPVFFGGPSPEAIEVAGRHADVYALWGETLEQVRESVLEATSCSRPGPPVDRRGRADEGRR